MTDNALAELVNELIVWDVPQTCVCGSFCDLTALGEAVNILREAGLLFDTAGRDSGYGAPCEDEHTEEWIHNR